MDSKLTIRHAEPGDDAAIAILSERDSAAPPRGPRLIAEIDGVAMAAMSLAEGTCVADPFRPTADIVEVLRTRRAQLVPAARARRLLEIRPSARQIVRGPSLEPIA